LCFSEWKWDYLTVGHFSWNDQSRRVIEKCGFSRIGEIEMATRCGTVEQVYKYCLTRDDWLSRESAAD
ncbi:MAG: GNAT family N-acetyltransferase, partial [Clostridia bacterium]|nr:GNAT family N-acetyltransferase [Clostridia bacterium]